jgi:hypothetical protein
MTEIEIFFADLTPEAQEKIKEAFGENIADDMNWDVIPMTFVALESD